MIAFLFTLGLAALLVVGGTIISLHLRAHGVHRLRSPRRLQMAPMDHTNISIADEEMSHYARKTLVALVFILAILSVIIMGAINAIIH